MDGARFDALTKRLAQGVSRRRLVTVLTGLLGTGLAGPQAASAVICRQAGATCLKDAQCCSGDCDPSSHRCACVDGTMECVDSTHFRTCDQGTWVVRACAPGLVCLSFQGSILCDFPGQI